MGCKCCKTTAYEKQEDDRKKRRRHDQPKPKIDVDPDDPSESDLDISQHEIKQKIPKLDETVSRHSTVVDELDDIEVADPEAFNQAIIQQRKKAVAEPSYRLTIESWKPNSLPELAETIKIFSKGKSLVDRHWIIFYWVAFNIEYDTVSYFSKDYKDQSAEGVFRTREGVCAGYANIYKYLCDQLQMPCEVISGYSKGYGFDSREGAPTETDHAWNAVEIYNHWYLMESTWGAGHLNEQKLFKRHLESYYFLPRPNEMIYHHLPKDDKWQLLRKPIKMEQYMQMPQLRPLYFEFKLEMIQPRNQCFVKLEKDKSFALVIIKAPTDVFLIADLKLHDQKIEGGDRVIFDKRKRLFYCYFAPANLGKNKMTIYAKRGTTDAESYNSVLDLTLEIKKMPENPISYPNTWKSFFDLGLEVISPRDTHLIIVNNGATHTQIQIRTPENVELLGRLENENGQELESGNRVYFDRQKNIWRCNFAPDRNGIFKATIMAKKKSDPGSYSAAVAFQIEAKQVPLPCLSYPYTWQLFYDLGLKVEAPKNTSNAVWSDKASFAEVLIEAPDDVELLGQLKKENGQEVERGNRVYFDRQKNIWRCNFAPDRNGIFKATIMAKKKSDPGSYSAAVAFQIEAKQVPLPCLSYPYTWQLFYDLGLKVEAPKNTSNAVWSDKASFAEVLIEAPDDVELLGQLKKENGQEVERGNRVYFDRQKNIWRCNFAPDRNGIFKATIMAKKKSDPGSYSAAVAFQIEAKQVPLPCLSYPYTWQLFYDLGLKVEAPKNRSDAVWSDDASFAEVLIKAPNDVQLSCNIEYDNVKIENGSLAQFDNAKRLWQLLFAPERAGPHELIIYAKRNNDDESSSNAVVKFNLNVTKIRRPMKFPLIYTQFQTKKCQIYAPMDGILKKDSIVPMHCVIPGATDVNLTVDSKWLQTEGYKDPILQRKITVGSKEVVIYGKYGQESNYDALVKYTVH